MNHVRLKKIGLWILTFLLFAAHVFFRSQAQAAEWKMVDLSDCRISFPTAPQSLEKKLKLKNSNFELEYTIFLSPYLSQSVCVLLKARYPGEVSQDKENESMFALLNGILNRFNDSVLVFSNPNQIQGFSGVQFMIKTSSGYFRAQAIMVYNRLYLIAIEGNQTDYSEKAFEDFLHTFILKNAQNP